MSDTNLTSENDTPRQAWSRDEDFFNYSSLGDLLDSHDDLEVGDQVYVGDVVDPDWPAFFDASDLVESLNERAYDTCGECAEDWPQVSDEAKCEFENFMKQWITKHCPVTFYTVANVRPYSITAEDLA